jgi:5'(3')-deoxyribonucleotidase
MTKKRILVDMDQILVALNDEWLRVHNEENDDNVTIEDIKTWELEDHVNKNPDGLYAIIERPGFFDDLKPIPGAIEGFKALRNSGHTVVVCTSPASDDSARAKFAWCKKHLGLNRRDVIVMHKKYWLAGTCDVLIVTPPKN